MEITETTLADSLMKMNKEQADQFAHRSKHTTTVTEKVELAESILHRDRVKVTEGIYMGQPLSADDHRAKAKAHQDRADELKAGDKKDLNTAAAAAHTKAADCIDAANASSAKAALLD